MALNSDHKDSPASETPDVSDIFECQKCGDCCSGYGGTYVTEKDIEAISDYIGSDSRSFVADYCRMSGGKPLLAQAENGKCVFWDGLCTIHPVKPRMCKAWPFIESVLIDANNWEMMATACPGIRTGFPHHVVQAIVRKERLKLKDAI